MVPLVWLLLARIGVSAVIISITLIRPFSPALSLSVNYIIC